MKKNPPPPNYDQAFERKIHELRENGHTMDSPAVLANLCGYCLENLYNMDIPICAECSDKLIRLFSLISSEPVVVVGHDPDCEEVLDEEDYN